MALEKRMFKVKRQGGRVASVYVYLISYEVLYLW